MSLSLGDMITTNYGLGENQRARLQELKDKYKELIDVIDKNLINSREKSLALTKIQEGLMWTTRSIAIEPTDPFGQK